MAVHGVTRSTRGLDLLVVAPACLAPEFWEPLEARGASVVVRRGGARDPLAGVVRVTRAGEPPVDLVVGREGWQARILQRAREAEIEGARVPVARAADLVLLKLYAGGPLDAWDVEQLLAGPGGAVLVAEVEEGIAGLPAEARALWRRILQGRSRG